MEDGQVGGRTNEALVGQHGWRKRTPRLTDNHPALQKKPGTRTPEELWEIVEMNRGLIFSRLKSLGGMSGTSSTLDWNDISQEAILALHKAAVNFDPAKGMKFSTLAVHYLRFEVMRVGEKDRMPSGGSRTHRKGAWNTRLAWLNSLDEMTEHRAEQNSDDGGEPENGNLPVLSGGYHDDYTADQVDRDQVYDEVAEVLDEQNRYIFDQWREGVNFEEIAKGWPFKKRTYDDMPGVTRELVRQRFAANIEPQIRRRLERGME
jgi:hypothetical protein